jgi:hypothetical protein
MMKSCLLVKKEISIVVADPKAIETDHQQTLGEDSESVGDILQRPGADTDLARKPKRNRRRARRERT